MWVAATPHFCGAEDCEREGQYEIRLEQGECVWAKQQERDDMLQALEAGKAAWARPEEEWETDQAECRPSNATNYKWRETYFVLFDSTQTPVAEESRARACAN